MPKGKDYFNPGLDYCWPTFSLWSLFKYPTGQGTFHIKLHEMVTCDVHKIILNCSPMIGHLFETIIAALTSNQTRGA